MKAILTAFLTPAHVTGYLAVVIGAVDSWAFHASFGLIWDQGLIIGGLSLAAGASFPSLAPVVAAVTAKGGSGSATQ